MSEEKIFAINYKDWKKLHPLCNKKDYDEYIERIKKDVKRQKKKYGGIL